MRRTSEKLTANVFALANVLWFAIVFSPVAAAKAETSDEYQVKAAFILNFLKFSEITLKDSKDVSICIIRNSIVFAASQLLQDRRVAEHKVKVILIQDTREASLCDVVFIPASEEASEESFLKVSANYSILTIGESDDFIERGGAIAFVRSDERIRFVISLKNAREAKISFSAKLLALAMSTER